MINPISPAFIRAIPKTDLHVHIDGSLRLASLIELARERGVELPSYTESGLMETVFKESYSSLAEYLHGFKYTCAVLQDAESLERAAYELGVDSFAEGARYIEPRFAPQLHVSDELDMPRVLQAVDRGLARACAEFNALPGVRSGAEPPHRYGIIGCAMRLFTESFSPYYRALWNVHRFSPAKDVHRMGSLELARALVKIRDESGMPIVGFDLAGREDGYPAHDHVEAYRFAHRNFMHKTVHAGEAYGPESIFEAITLLYADRLGHGYYLFDADKIGSPLIEDPAGYCAALAEYIADRRITIEVCLTSNLQTNPSLRRLADHPFRLMVDKRISTTLCTDNRLVSRTTICREIELAVSELGLTPTQLKNCVLYGFKRAFMQMSYLDKRDYVRRVIDYYENLERECKVG